MTKAQIADGIEPLPRYAMPDKSEPEYSLILDELQDDVHSRIGKSYFYIKEDEHGCMLCRVIHGGGRIYFHEIVDHRQHGISDEDIEFATDQEALPFEIPGHFHISSLMEKKLRAFMEFS